MIDDFLKKLIEETVLLTLRNLHEENNTEKEQEVMDTKQLAKFLGISIHWVYKHTNEIPHTKIGRKSIFRKNEIEEWEKEKKEEKKYINNKVIINRNSNKNCIYKVS